VSSTEAQGELNRTSNAVVLEHNRMAAEVMGRNGVSIDDLYGVASKHLELQKPDGIHWGKEGAEVLGTAVAGVLEKVVEQVRTAK
jgi:hypothetical protein